MRRAVAAIVAIGLLAIGCGAAGPAPSDVLEVPGPGSSGIDVARSAGTGGDECSLALDPAASLEDRASGLRAAGLFADRSSLTDAELATELERALRSEWGDSVTSRDALFELFLAELDRSRVWWRDLEADVFEGNGVYVAVLGELSAISEGAFEPESVSESWASEAGPVTVAFELGSREHVLEPAYLEDWIDPAILDEINGLVEESGRRFEIVEAFDQTAFVMALTADERAALEARGWCFE